jgi:WD40 repeat protein
MTRILYVEESSDDEAMQATPAPAPQQAVAAPQGPIAMPKCCGSIKVDYSRDPAYVFRVVCRDGGAGRLEQVAASISNNLIKLYAVTGPQVTHVSNLPSAAGEAGHTATITGLDWAPDDPALLYSCGHDGVVRCWDTRTSKQAQA